MDLSFQTSQGKFNYRVCAMMISNGRILAMRDDHSPYFYLPGGRVKMGETAEQAVIREMQEELNLTLKIARPLWLNQGFFTEDVEGIRYHELCLYFLMDFSHTDILSRGQQFITEEGNRRHVFQWLEFHQLKQEYFYPLFLKEAIFHLPEQFTIRTEWE